MGQTRAEVGSSATFQIGRILVQTPTLFLGSWWTWGQVSIKRSD